MNLSDTVWGFISRSRSFLLTGAMLSSLLLPTLALADDDKAPPSGRSSGGRGCGSATALTTSTVPALILLTPQQQRGQTAATRPTFAWFVRATSPRPLEFRLYEVEPNQFKLVKEVKSDRLTAIPGIMVLPFTPSDPELVVGKRYRWQVELVCDANRPSSNLFAEAEFEVVPLQANLKTQLSRSKDRVGEARLYLQANLWLDALAILFEGIGNSTKPPGNAVEAKALITSTLSRVATNATEQTLLQNSPIHRIQRD